MLVRVDELRNQCVATLELTDSSKEWLVEWINEAYKDETLIADRIEIMELAIAKYVQRKLDRALGE